MLAPTPRRIHQHSKSKNHQSYWTSAYDVSKQAHMVMTRNKISWLRFRIELTYIRADVTCQQKDPPRSDLDVDLLDLVSVVSCWTAFFSGRTFFCFVTHSSEFPEIAIIRTNRIMKRNKMPVRVKCTTITKREQWWWCISFLNVQNLIIKTVWKCIHRDQLAITCFSEIGLLIAAVTRTVNWQANVRARVAGFV